jgi:hypothetical protein
MTAAMQDQANTQANGWISARGGKWHRATTPEPVAYRTEDTACGLTFRPLNITWHGEAPYVDMTVSFARRHVCKRPGCAQVQS